MITNNEWVFGKRRVAYLKTLSVATRTAVNCSKDSEDVVMFCTLVIASLECLLHQ